jgi:hypothetical protein
VIRGRWIRRKSSQKNKILQVCSTGVYWKEAANLKLASVATDILGFLGRAMVAAVVQGETDPTALAQLARGRLRPKQAQLVAALTGRVTVDPLPQAA